MSKIGRNAPCPCGSGTKYKRCHGRLDSRTPSSSILKLLEQSEVEERVRQRQQGLGKPIVSLRHNEHQIVGVGNTVYFSKGWKTFPDFLAGYIKRKIGPDWGNAEIAKPLDQRHPLMQWYEGYCNYQRTYVKKPGEITSSPITGVVACYLGTAYSLYLLDHNVELQERLINRLKDPGNFQGAYYELIVASALIRAGFVLTLEDEEDGDAKHCEFAAVSRKTGKRYWVEAKMRGVAGFLGRTGADGGPDKKPIKQLIPHLNKALAKPATDERLVFLDLNAPPTLLTNGQPDWLEPACQRLEAFERNELKEGMTAYVFLTNASAHRQLEETPMFAAVPFGLGFPDFNRPGPRRVSEPYREKQKHVDAYDIGEAFTRFAAFPTTFDGRLPSESYGAPTNRVIIGEKYRLAEGGLGEVTAATVNEVEKEIVVAVATEDGSNRILKAPMSDDALAEYREFADVYFGARTSVTKRAKNEFELFEWLMETNKNTPRQRILDWFGKSVADPAKLETLEDEELRIAYCEALVSVLVNNKRDSQELQS